MRLATLANGTPDGRLVIVSADGARFCAAPAPNLLTAIEDWNAHETALQECANALEDGAGEVLDPSLLQAPLPRSWQWLDGSAFSTHAELMQIAFSLPPIETDRPLMYQGMSDRFYGPNDPVLFPSEADGIDFEGEFGVIVDAVPMGVTPAEALHHIKLVVQINDWSLRAIAPIEMKTGFGWVQAKPACSMAPFAVTPASLGDGWRDGRVCLDLEIDWNGRRFGSASGSAMDFGFHDLVSHAARTRELVAGTIVGSGTVSNANYAEVGSSCISELRAIEIIRDGAASTPFLHFGDTIRMAGRSADGGTPFGAMKQRIDAAPFPRLCSELP
jgi:fumarylacetoacetate (FAA) hydrolase